MFTEHFLWVSLPAWRAERAQTTHLDGGDTHQGSVLHEGGTPRVHPGPWRCCHRAAPEQSQQGGRRLEPRTAGGPSHHLPTPSDHQSPSRLRLHPPLNEGEAEVPWETGVSPLTPQCSPTAPGHPSGRPGPAEPSTARPRMGVQCYLCGCGAGELPKLCSAARRAAQSSALGPGEGPGCSEPL